MEAIGRSHLDLTATIMLSELIDSTVYSPMAIPPSGVQFRRIAQPKRTQTGRANFGACDSNRMFGGTHGD